MQSKKSELESQIKKMEKFIYENETKYLEGTISSGNILRGWDHFFTSKSKIPNAAMSSGKRIRISNNERVFSQTSFNNQFLKEENLMNSQSGFKSLGGNNNPNRNTLPHKHKKKITQSLSMKKKNLHKLLGGVTLNSKHKNLIHIVHKSNFLEAYESFRAQLF